MESRDVIAILNENFMRELEATLIYVRNSFVMKGCEGQQGHRGHSCG